MSSSLNLIVYFLCFMRRFGLNIVAPSQEQTNQATGTELYIKTPPILLNQGRTFNLELKQPLSPAFCLRMPQVKAQNNNRLKMRLFLLFTVTISKLLGIY